MVEKWLQNRIPNNPYLNVKKPVRNIKRYSPTSVRYGKPNVLFKDNDKDGVMNVFDCQPNNKRKQDVVAPSSTGNPMMDMHYRQEQNRQYKKYMDELNRSNNEMERYNKEIERLSTPNFYTTEYKVLVLGGGNDALGRPITKTTKEVAVKRESETSSETSSGNSSRAGIMGIMGTGNVVKGGASRLNTSTITKSGPYVLSKAPTLVSTIKSLVTGKK